MKNAIIHLIYSHGVAEFFTPFQAKSYMSAKAEKNNALPMKIICSDVKQGKLMEGYFSQLQTSLKSEVL